LDVRYSHRTDSHTNTDDGALGLGAAFGTAKSGIGIAGIGTYRPDLIMKSLIPVVMSGIIAVYALVISVLVSGSINPDSTYSLFTGFLHLAAGLSVGLAGLAAGYAIGIVGDKVHWSLPQFSDLQTNTNARVYDLLCSNQEYLLAWF
jgi:ATP synthase proteolipid subunit